MLSFGGKGWLSGSCIADVCRGMNGGGMEPAGKTSPGTGGVLATDFADFTDSERE